MCFHLSQTKIGRELQERYNATVHLPEDVSEVPFYYHINGFVHPKIIIIPQEEPSVITTAVWGMAPENENPESLPHYYKKAVTFGGGLNAQSEKIFTHFLYKQSIFSKRCLIPITGFYEPHESGGKKFPYFIKRNDNDSFSLAGLYTQLGTIFTCTILTKRASAMFENIHNVKKRQPVLIERSMEEYWLNDIICIKEIQEVLDFSYPENELSAFPVYRKIFQTKEDSNTPDSQKPLEYPELQKLF